jgi:hypothetical protein
VDTSRVTGNHATVRKKDLKIFHLERAVASPPTARATRQAARRWTSQIVAVELADEAIRPADLTAARERTAVLLGHEQRRGRSRVCG